MKHASHPYPSNKMLPLRTRIKRKVRRLFGKELVVAPAATGAQNKTNLPKSALDVLKPNNQALEDLRKRYEKSQLPMAVHSWWGKERTSNDMELAWFRGDNAYVWQTRHMGTDPKTRYFLYAQDIIAHDHLNLLNTLDEDGAFGCWTFQYQSLPTISRDLLDSIHEINFLEEHLLISKGHIKNILDIGAGYGRLAHRCHQAWPSVENYICTDGVAESTHICQYYVKYRQLEDRVSVLPLDEVATFSEKIDLTINIHSFSEMRLEAVQGWLDEITRLNSRYLFIIPNDSKRFLSIESDHTRLDFLPLIEAAGYTQIASRPLITNPDIREMVGVKDQMYLFEKIAQ